MDNSSTLTIQSLNIRTVAVAMPNPHQTASGIITESPLVLIDLTTNSGVVGHSIIFTYTRAALKPTADLIQNMAPLLVDEPLAPMAIAQKLSQKFRLLGTQGLVGMALAGIDMALWDALARTQQLSLIQILGGQPKTIPAYGAVGYDGMEGSAQVAAQWAEKGMKGIKAKIGYPTVEEDIAVIRAMRQAIGAEMAIMVDYNQSLSPVEAIKRLQRLDQEGLTWVEEPTLAHDYPGHAQIAEQIQTPIQCGENWWGIQDMQHALNHKASDYMMLDVMKIGGVTGWIKAAAMAEAQQIEISSHLWSEISAQLLCCTPTANWLEYCDWWNPILKQPLEIQDGMAVIGDVMGSGIEWDEKQIEHFLV